MIRPIFWIDEVLFCLWKYIITMFAVKSYVRQTQFPDPHNSLGTGHIFFSQQLNDNDLKIIMVLLVLDKSSFSVSKSWGFIYGNVVYCNYLLPKTVFIINIIKIKPYKNLEYTLQ